MTEVTVSRGQAAENCVTQAPFNKIRRPKLFIVIQDPKYKLG